MEDSTCIYMMHMYFKTVDSYLTYNKTKGILYTFTRKIMRSTTGRLENLDFLISFDICELYEI